jgi:hypothetical protein
MGSTSCCSWENVIGRRIKLLAKGGKEYFGQVILVNVSRYRLSIELLMDDGERRNFEISPPPKLLDDGCDNLTFAVSTVGVVTIL